MPGSAPQFVLKLAEQQLSRDGQPCELPPKALALLGLLVRHRRCLLTKQELLKGVWGKTHVGEALVKDHIKTLRSVLEDDADSPHHIETVRGRGYRYIGNLELHEPSAGPSQLTAASSQPSVAVLAFADDYLGEGLASDVLYGLSRHRQLVVVSQLASFRFGHRPEDVGRAARTLGAHWLVTGEFTHDATRLQLRVSLTDVRSGRAVWGEHYDRRLTDIFDVREELVRRIVATIAGQVEHAEICRAFECEVQALRPYAIVLQARHKLEGKTQEGVLEARTLLEQAVIDHPSYAPAYTWLAETLYWETQAPWAPDPDASARRAFELGQKAVELDAWDSLAHLVLAWGYFRVEGSQELARAQLEFALELNPNDYYALCYDSWFSLCVGELQRAIDSGLAALQRVPIVSDMCLSTLGFAFYLTHDYPRALDAFGRMTAPRLETDAGLAATYARLERPDDAARAAARCLERAPAATFDPPNWSSYWRRVLPFRDEQLFTDLLGGLALAGLPGDH